MSDVINRKFKYNNRIKRTSFTLFPPYVILIISFFTNYLTEYTDFKEIAVFINHGRELITLVRYADLDVLCFTKLNVSLLTVRPTCIRKSSPHHLPLFYY